MSRGKPAPPHPELQRRPSRAYGWLDAALLKDRWLEQVGADGVAVMAFLALVADERGASYWGRARIAVSLSMSMDRVSRALHRLQSLGLVDFRPWKVGDPDGVWQLMPLDSAS